MLLGRGLDPAAEKHSRLHPHVVSSWTLLFGWYVRASRCTELERMHAKGNLHDELSSPNALALSCSF